MLKRLATRRVKKTDAARLSLFDLEQDEQPIETIVGWMPFGFANILGMDNEGIYPSPPPDGYMGISHDEWFDPAESAGRGQIWGHSIAIAHVLILVTDRRLIWLPIDGEARTDWKASTPYTTFTSKTLGPRSIELEDIQYIEAINMRDTINLVEPLTTRFHVRLQLTSQTPFGGEPYPIWTPGLIPGWFAEGDELQVLITNGQEMIADLLAVALSYVGIPTKPPEWASASLSARPQWKPQYLKYQAAD